MTGAVPPPSSEIRAAEAPASSDIRAAVPPAGSDGGVADPNARSDAVSAEAATDRAEAEEGAFCIFCLEPAEESQLLGHSPCLCSGSLSAIHHSCMRQDLSKNLRLQCSICQYPFHYDARVVPQTRNRNPASKNQTGSVTSPLCHSIICPAHDTGLRARCCMISMFNEATT
jgi:hypothetical protein